MADLWNRLGRIPLARIRIIPPPGTATEKDVLAARREPYRRLCELVDGTLVEKDLPASVSTGRPETLADLLKQLGKVPLRRIRFWPPLGTATEADVIAAREAPERRLFELVDGVLIEKALGTKESLIAAYLVHVLWQFVRPRRLGVVLGADGMLRLLPHLVRIPDVSFISRARLNDPALVATAIAALVPDLAVEVLSESNTRTEIKRKLRDYFRAGTRLVWVIDPKEENARICTSRTKVRRIDKDGILDGEDVLPGFRLSLAKLFSESTELWPSDM